MATVFIADRIYLYTKFELEYIPLLEILDEFLVSPQFQNLRETNFLTRFKFRSIPELSASEIRACKTLYNTLPSFNVDTMYSKLFTVLNKEAKNRNIELDVVTMYLDICKFY